MDEDPLDIDDGSGPFEPIPQAVVVLLDPGHGRRRARHACVVDRTSHLLCHVWMAPAGQGCRIGSGELVGCGHVYGV